MRARLLALVFALILAGHLGGASADDEASLAYVSPDSEAAPQTTEPNLRRAHAGVIASSVGLIISATGIIAGVVLLTRSESCVLTQCDQVMATAEKRHTAGKALLIISPITLAASIAGVVVSRRTREKAHPSEPRKPASWR